jgi:hypothetical protein
MGAGKKLSGREISMLFHTPLTPSATFQAAAKKTPAQISADLPDED